MVADLCASLGLQGDAYVQTERVVDGRRVAGQPWSNEQERGVSVTRVRQAARMVARRRLADRALSGKARERQERSLAERIRRAYYHALASKRVAGSLRRV